MNQVSAAASATALVALIAAVTVWANYDAWFVLPKARQLVAAQLNDPLSAQFRNDRFIDYDWHCGEVNAKNAMGGYVGFRRFIYGRISKIAYIEGVGLMGKEPTAEVLLIMDKVIANLKMLNSMKAQVPDLRLPPESQQYATARGQVFEDHWKAICERK